MGAVPDGWAPAPGVDTADSPSAPSIPTTTLPRHDGNATEPSPLSPKMPTAFGTVPTVASCRHWIASHQLGRPHHAEAIEDLLALGPRAGVGAST